MKKKCTQAFLLAFAIGCTGQIDGDSIGQQLRDNGTRPSVDCPETQATGDFAAVARAAGARHSFSMRGALGCLGPESLSDGLVGYLEQVGVSLGAAGTESFSPRSALIHDERGRVHMRAQQKINGMPVVGADVIVEADERTGRVNSLIGTMAVDRSLPALPTVDQESALSIAVAQANLPTPTRRTEPELTYILDQQGQPRLAWVASFAYESDQGPEQDLVFASAIDGELIARHPQFHRALNRSVRDAENRPADTINADPGPVVLVEGGNTADEDVQAVYDSSQGTYNYFQTKFGRDSYDGAGAEIRSVVHVGSNYNNAFWTGTFLGYGDGDGSLFGPFSRAHDVVAHEFTHAVTQNTANLVYANESGALNESMSDVFGAASEAFLAGGTSANTWMIGEDAWTPGTDGDAMRYMNNPTLDDFSRDHWDTRFLGDEDNGGVHLNSGIPNLVFYLLVQGGSHPRGLEPESVVVAIGLAQAENIFYTALTTKMVTTTNFEQARVATASAAEDLYGIYVADAVHTAWDAVGVPGVHPPLPLIEPDAGVPVETTPDAGPNMVDPPEPTGRIEVQGGCNASGTTPTAIWLVLIAFALFYARRRCNRVAHSQRRTW